MRQNAGRVNSAPVSTGVGAEALPESSRVAKQADTSAPALVQKMEKAETKP